jgi:putative transposase
MAVTRFSKSNIIWGRHLWARGYFCATVGDMTDEMIRQYLEHHFEQSSVNAIGIEI